jgi:hypothetical protein
LRENSLLGGEDIAKENFFDIFGFDIRALDGGWQVSSA